MFLRTNLLLILACGAALTIAQATSAAEPPAMALPQYDKDGQLLRPDGYERWTLVGTSVGVSYSDDKPKPDSPGMFHNVYVQPQAFDHYVQTGEFPEQTVFVVTNNPAVQKQGAKEISQRGHFADPPTGLEVSVKDSQRYPDGWGYFMYYKTTGPPQPAKPFPTASCYECHATHGEEDAVFTQFYAVLKTARAQRANPPTRASED